MRFPKTLNTIFYNGFILGISVYAVVKLRKQKMRSPHLSGGTWYAQT